MLKKTILLTTIIMIFFSGIISFAQGDFITNPGFESIKDSWSETSWDSSAGKTSFSIDDISHKGKKSALIVSNAPNDSRLKQEITVEGGKTYKLSCYVRTENVGTETKGANISVEGILDTSEDVTGTSNDWQYIELYGITDKNQKSMTVTLGLGGYGNLNTGKAWFDDVTVEEVNTLPQGVTAVNFFTTNNTGTPSEGANQNEGSSNIPDTGTVSNTGLQDANDGVNLFIILSLLIAAFIFFFIKFDKTGKLSAKSQLILYLVIAAGFILRVIMGSIVEGHRGDMACFKGWALTAAKSLPDFYINSSFADYPPAYIYVLYLLGKLAGALNIVSVDWAFNLLIKLPSILADLLSAFLIFKLSERFGRRKIGIIAAVLYIFNPLVILDSTIWGQVDSFLTLFVMGALYTITRDKLNLSAVLFAVAVLIKPQGIIFLPVMFFELVRRKKVKHFVTTIASGLATCILILVPFTLNRELFWIFKLYFNTAGQYPYASLNAFNLYTLFGLNWVEDSNTFLLLSYNTWGLIFIVLVTLFTGFLYYKGKGPALPYASALILISGVFVLSSRMHERYFFPALAFALMVLVITNDRRILYIVAASSVTIFANIWVAYYNIQNENFWLSGGHPSILPVSLANILLLAYLIKVVYDIIVKEKTTAVWPGFTDNTISSQPVSKYEIKRRS